MMHASRYFVKGGNIQPKGDIFWLISQHDSLPCTFGEVPPRLAEKRKKLKFHCCVGFKNVPVFETTPTKSSYFPMSTYGTYAGRAALYPYNAGQGIYFHCDYIHNDACLWHLSYGSRIFCKMYGHLGFSTFSKPSSLR